MPLNEFQRQTFSAVAQRLEFAHWTMMLSDDLELPMHEHTDRSPDYIGQTASLWHDKTGRTRLIRVGLRRVLKDI